MENWKLYKTYDDKIEEMKIKHKEEIEEKEAVIEALKAKIRHLEAVQDRDGTNTSVPTSQTPTGKTKVIPNKRKNRSPKRRSNRARKDRNGSSKRK